MRSPPAAVSLLFVVFVVVPVHLFGVVVDSLRRAANSELLKVVVAIPFFEVA